MKKVIKILQIYKICSKKSSFNKHFGTVLKKEIDEKRAKNLPQFCDKKPLQQQKNLKKQSDNKKTPPKTSITQQ